MQFNQNLTRMKTSLYNFCIKEEIEMFFAYYYICICAICLCMCCYMCMY